ncbi:hypothetical protein [Clostridium sp. J1101437_171009_A5]|uniref:hypothetical protein n=1 Tax=Clostridium sp. J1101437_171009_A5 TaxID=2787098 RepID=UPI001898706D|nr:hypothetical protein [Clostridium sp. J1101437_171009_A5]
MIVYIQETEVNQMTEKERKIMQTISEAVKTLNEEQQERYLLVVQGAAAMAVAMRSAS